MSSKYPHRPMQHELEEESLRFFRQAIPKQWTAEKPQPDYGVDLKVDIFEEGFARGLEFLVQLKSSAEQTAGDFEQVRLKVATYNMLREKVQVVMLAKYVASQREGYWMLLKAIPPPSDGNEEFTIHIPKKNVLSSAPWHDIAAYVRKVTEGKLQWREGAKLDIPGTN